MSASAYLHWSLLLAVCTTRNLISVIPAFGHWKIASHRTLIFLTAHSLRTLPLLIRVLLPFNVVTIAMCRQLHLPLPIWLLHPLACIVVCNYRGSCTPLLILPRWLSNGTWRLQIAGIVHLRSVVLIQNWQIFYSFVGKLSHGAPLLLPPNPEVAPTLQWTLPYLLLLLRLNLRESFRLSGGRM